MFCAQLFNAFRKFAKGLSNKAMALEQREGAGDLALVRVMNCVSHCCGMRSELEEGSIDTWTGDAFHCAKEVVNGYVLT